MTTHRIDGVKTFCCGVDISCYTSPRNSELKYYYCSFCQEQLSTDGKQRWDWRKHWAPYHDFDHAVEEIRGIISFYAAASRQAIPLMVSTVEQQSAFRLGANWFRLNYLDKTLTEGDIDKMAIKFFPLPNQREFDFDGTKNED